MYLNYLDALGEREESQWNVKQYVERGAMTEACALVLPEHLCCSQADFTPAFKGYLRCDICPKHRFEAPAVSSSIVGYISFTQLRPI